MTEQRTIRVLVVEDNPGDSRHVQHMLGESTDPHFRVTPSGTLADGLARAREEACDITLLDLTLPDSSGMDTVNRFLEACPAIPVVVLTGLDDSATGMQAVKAGAQDFLVKGHGDATVLRRAILYAMERKETERTIQGLLHHNNLILNSLGEGVVGLDEAGTVTFCNAGLESMLGWPCGQVTGSNLHRLMHHTRADGTPIPPDDCVILQTLRDGAPRRVDDETLWHRDGYAVPVEILVTPIREAEALTGAVVAVRDVTDREHAFETLRYQLGFQQHVLDAVPLPIVYTDSANVILGCNGMFEAALSVTRDHLVGQQAEDALAPDLAGRLDERSLPADGQPRVGEVRLGDGAGGTVLRRLRTVGFAGPEGATAGVVGTLLDAPSAP